MSRDVVAYSCSRSQVQGASSRGVAGSTASDATSPAVLAAAFTGSFAAEALAAEHTSTNPNTDHTARRVPDPTAGESSVSPTPTQEHGDLA